MVVSFARSHHSPLICGIGSTLYTIARWHYSTLLCGIFVLVLWILDQYGPTFNGMISELLTISSETFIMTTATDFHKRELRTAIYHSDSSSNERISGSDMVVR